MTEREVYQRMGIEAARRALAGASAARGRVLGHLLDVESMTRAIAGGVSAEKRDGFVAVARVSARGAFADAADAAARARGREAGEARRYADAAGDDDTIAHVSSLLQHADDAVVEADRLARLTQRLARALAEGGAA